MTTQERIEAKNIVRNVGSANFMLILVTIKQVDLILSPYFHQMNNINILDMYAQCYCRNLN